jgi:hypothetical protein
MHKFARETATRTWLARMFERIGETVTAHPWGYLGGGNEAKSFAAARKQALAGTGR